MSNRWIKVLRAVVLAIGISAAIVLPAGNIASNIVRSNYNQKIDELRSSFANILSSYATFGLSKETDNVINGFLSSVPADMNSNIVIVDPSGAIQYKLNDNYLHTNSNKVSMAWNSFGAVSIDQAGESTWYRMEWIGGWDVGTYPDKEGSIDSFGMTNYTADKLTDMLDSYYLVKTPDAMITIYGFSGNDAAVEDHSARSCVMWIRDANAYDKATAGTVYVENYTAPASLLLLLAFWLLAPVYIFLDARGRRIQPLPWALLVLVTNIVGMIVYWIVQNQNGKAEQGPACPSCGKPVRREYPFCPWCSASLVKVCPACGKPVEKDWIACPWCGKPSQ